MVMSCVIEPIIIVFNIWLYSTQHERDELLPFNQLNFIDIAIHFVSNLSDRQVSWFGEPPE